MIAVGVVTTAGREDYLNATMKSLDNDVNIYKDLEPGALRNKIAAWQKLYETDADWLMLIEDDVIAARNWLMTANLFTRVLPDSKLIQLFSARKDVVEHTEQGYFNMPISNWVGEQALIISRHVWLGFYQDYTDNTYLNYCDDERGRELYFDYIFRRYMINYRYKQVVTSSPTVFDHVGMVSTFGHAWKMAGKERKSRLFIGEQSDSFAYFSERIK